MEYKIIQSLPGYAGIYLLTNKVNNKHYVGQSTSLKRRIKAHFHNYNNDHYKHIALYRGMQKYGIENFELTVLDTFRDAMSKETKAKLDELEIRYIEQYNSYGPNGYNQTYGGDEGVPGYKHTAETLQKISENSKHQAEEKWRDPANWLKALNINDGSTLVFIANKYLAEHLGVSHVAISSAKNHKYLLRNTWYISNYYDEFPDINQLKERALLQKGKHKGHNFPPHKDKDAIMAYIKEHPRCSYREIKQQYNICQKTFYNYRNELGIKFDQCIDCTIPKDEFVEYYKSHTPKECMEHFNINYYGFNNRKRRYILGFPKHNNIMNTLTYPYIPSLNDLYEGNITPQGPALQIVSDRILDAVRTFIAETEQLGLTDSLEFINFEDELNKLSVKDHSC